MLGPGLPALSLSLTAPGSVLLGKELCAHTCGHPGLQIQAPFIFPNRKLYLGHPCWRPILEWVEPVKRPAQALEVGSGYLCREFWGPVYPEHGQEGRAWAVGQHVPLAS